MAYAALISLKNTIKSLQRSTIFPGREVENVHWKVQSLKEFMESECYLRRTGKDADVLERQVADAIYKLEDVLESFVSIDSLSRVASYENVKQQISCFLKTERNFQLRTLDFNTIAEDQLIARNYWLSGDEQNMMVGFEEDIISLMDRPTSPYLWLQIISIVGMRGIGKTTLVKQVHRKPFIRNYFDKSAFVTIGQRCSVRKILLDIIVKISGSQVDEWNGETDDQLLVRPHIRIRSCRSNPSFLPMDIWNMKELRRLYIIGSDLPNPCGKDQLPSLQILSGVSPQSCTMDVLEGIQQLKKLGIRIELTPGDDAAEPLRPFDHLSVLRRLESFKCVVVNPNFESQILSYLIPNQFSQLVLER